MSGVSGSQQTTDQPPRGTLFKVAIASWLGTLVDYYDFFLAGFVAGSVWPSIFFPTGNAAIATAVSISVYATTYLVRPIGAFIFGHIGDKFGRQQTLLWTLTLAGVGMVGIALTPSYASIGYLAPALVTLFRLIFGLGIGGEWGGAIVWVGEYAAKSKWRPLWMGWIQSGVPGGRVISGVAVAAASSALGNAGYISWGWRALFLGGAVVLAVAIVMRYKLAESPLFAALQRKKAVEKSPAIQVLKLHWRMILRLACATNFQISVPAIMVLPFTLVYLEKLAEVRHVSGITTALISLAISVGSMALIGGQVVGGIAGSIIGRRKTCLISAVMTVVVILIYFPLINTLNVFNIFLADSLIQFAFAPGAATVGVLAAEHFETKHRVTGAGLCYQIGGLIGGVTAGIMLPLLIVVAPSVTSQWPYVTALAIAATLLSVIGLALTKETKGIELK